MPKKASAAAEAAEHTTQAENSTATRWPETEPSLPSLGLPGQAQWEWNLERDEFHFSPEWADMMAIPKHSSWSRKNAFWAARVHPEDIDELRAATDEVREGRKQDFEGIFRILRMDGTWAWMFSKGKRVPACNGKPEHIYGVTTNVSRLRLNSKFLGEKTGSNDLNYRSMLANSPDFIARLDRELFPLYANAALERYLPKAADELGESTASELGISAEHLDFLKASVERVFSTGHVVRERRTFSTCYRDETVGEFCFWPEFTPGGDVAAVICQMRDETSQVNMERKSRLNEKRLEALYQLIQMEHDPQEAVMDFVVESMTSLTESTRGYLFIPEYGEKKKPRMFWSKGHAETLDPEELPDDFIPEGCLIPTSGPEGDGLYRTINNGDGRTPCHYAFNGKLAVMRYMYSPAVDNNRFFCLGAVCNKETDYDEQDLQQLELFLAGAWMILRRREVLQALQRAKETAELASKVKGEFLTNVSHELRTPLNGMLGMLQLLELSNLTDQQQEYAHVASLSGKTLLRIISDILDFSRMESGKMELHEAPFDIRDTVRSTINLFARDAENRGIEIYSVVDDRLPMTLVGDDARVRQIIFNLVGNALKFTEQGCIFVECALLPDSRGNTVHMYLSVQDTGIGIADKHLDAIFDAFTQVDSTSTRRYSGTGLGLGIVKRLVHMMGGSIAVESQEGAGTTMHCSLYFEQAHERKTRKGQPVSSSQTPKRVLDILVAEDDPVGRFAVNAFLRRAGHRVVCVHDGRQALEALKIYPFHCLITDIQMPRMDGLEAAQRIRKGNTGDIVPSDAVRQAVEQGIPKAAKGKRQGKTRAIPRDLPITALTAHAMRGDKERFLELGMDLYLAKPVILEELNYVLTQLSQRVGAAKHSAAPGLGQAADNG